MGRQIYKPEVDLLPSGTISITNGGTAGITATNARANLQTLDSSQLNVANGIAQLTVSSLLKVENIPGLSAGPNIVGPDSVPINSKTSYLITDYDSRTTYTVTAISGSVSQDEEVIHYTAPASTGNGGFIINGNNYGIIINGAKIAPPSVRVPVHNSFDLEFVSLTFESTNFRVEGGTDTHASSSWQLATDANFTNIVASVTNSTTAKTTWTVAGLNPGTIYYVRVQHTGTSLGASEWSEYNMFSTKLNFTIANEEAKLVAADGASSDQFGISVAISSDGNTAIIGAHFDDSGRGSAYIYTRAGSSWSQQTKLVPADGASSDYFGYSVAISSDGNTAIIGARLDDTSRGSAYIYTRAGSSWSQQTKLVAADGAGGDQFGYSVAISSDGNTAIIGAYGDDDRGTNSGSAYIYTRTGSSWSQQTKLVAADGAGNDYFGVSVAISSDGNTAIIGAHGDDSSRGSAYIYTRAGSSWSQQTKLVAADGAGGDQFGYSVAISSDGNTAIIGAYGDDSVRGSAYIYTRAGSSWSQQTKLVLADGAIDDYFGISVAISSDGNTAIIGAYGDDDRGTNSGSAYIYTRTGSSWSQQTKLVAADGAGNDYFGVSVAISSDGNTAIIGAYGDDSFRGSAYIFV